MQRGANPTISNGRGQKAVELCSDVWLREAIGSYTEHWERQGQRGWTPPTPQPDDVEVQRRNQTDIVTLYTLYTLYCPSFAFIVVQFLSF